MRRKLKARRISWSSMSLQGLIRMKNEDNLLVPGGCLPLVHTDFGPESGAFICDGKMPACLSVFDGMGGEKRGEHASWLAADCCEKQVNEIFSEKWKEEHVDLKTDGEGLRFGQINDLCLRMNERICLNAQEKHVKMGTTAAGIIFDEKGAYNFNLGDSRIYRFSKGCLKQISVDHVPKNSRLFGNSITQYLGIPEQEFMIEPEIGFLAYETGDLFLLCTDGLFRTINDRRLAEILGGPETLEEKLIKMKDIVYKRGAEDNISAILCEVC